MMNPKDTHILSVLKRDGRVTWSGLAEQVHLSPSACQRRVEALIERGIIKGFAARLDEAALGQQVKAFIAVSVDRQNTSAAESFRNWVIHQPQVQACYMLSGAIDFMLEVVATDLAAFGAFIDRELLSLPAVKDASSSIVLNEVKSQDTYIP